MKYQSTALGLLGGAAMALGWLMPGTAVCAALGWISAFFLVLSAKSERPYRGSFFYGVSAHLLGFYWLVHTIKDFGGFGLVPALLIFALFAAGSATQNLIFIFISRHLPPALHRLGLGLALAWTASETFSIKIFPWHMGHTQLAFLTFAQTAAIGGTTLISFLMVFVAESAIDAAREKSLGRRALASGLIMALSLAWGAYSIQNYSDGAASRIDVSVVQANISIEEKHNQKFFKRNTERYVELSNPLAKAGGLVVWPESVIVDFVFDNTARLENDSRLPKLPNGASLLTGALTFDEDRNIYNSALFIDGSGEIPHPYHKQILMPFGEYTPLAGVFPWLLEINPTPEFTPGTDELVFNASNGARISPLICYEDVIPGISRRAVELGANLLVNLTNDAWFGDTAAPNQHHMIASFRAIENRRWLIRSTNSGKSAVVDALGQTTSSIANFSEGVIQVNAALRSEPSFYSARGGWLFPWIIVGLSLTLITAGRIRRLL